MAVQIGGEVAWDVATRDVSHSYLAISSQPERRHLGPLPQFLYFTC